MYLTDAGAWELIADYLEGGGAYFEMTLNVPPQAPALCFELSIIDPQTVYVKLQIGTRNVAIGRSFHFSER